MQGVSLGGWLPPRLAIWAWGIARSYSVGTPQLPGVVGDSDHPTISFVQSLHNRDLNPGCFRSWWEWGFVFH